jgi:hypothetical protein
METGMTAVRLNPRYLNAQFERVFLDSKTGMPVDVGEPYPPRFETGSDADATRLVPPFLFTDEHGHDHETH